jgi:hypothetical protein
MVFIRTFIKVATISYQFIRLPNVPAFRLIDQICVYISQPSLMSCMSSLSHLPGFAHDNTLEVYKLWISSLCSSFITCYFLPPGFKYFSLYLVFKPTQLYYVLHFEGPILLQGSNRYTGLDSPLKLQEFEAPRIFRQSAHQGGKVVSPTHRSPLHLPQEIPLILISVRS